MHLPNCNANKNKQICSRHSHDLVANFSQSRILMSFRTLRSATIYNLTTLINTIMHNLLTIVDNYSCLCVFICESVYLNWKTQKHRIAHFHLHITFPSNRIFIHLFIHEYFHITNVMEKLRKAGNFCWHDAVELQIASVRRLTLYCPFVSNVNVIQRISNKRKIASLCSG